MALKVTVSELNSFFSEAFPGEGTRPEIVDLEEGMARVRLGYSDRFLRPGGVISGPTQMSLADTATYAAIFTLHGMTPFAVTSNLNMNFLNGCKAGNVYATAKILKAGKRLIVAEVDIREETMTEPASHAIVTYALPSKPKT